ncbi:MAG: NADH-quinone oxidoreductase subunit J [Nitrososphaerales archaeon]
MADPAFIAVSVITIASAVIALEFREIIYGAIALAISLLGIAMFFVMLEATFVAMFQVAVYVGAVVVLVIFTIMLVRREAWMVKPERRRKAVGLAIMFVTMFGLGAVFINSGLSGWHVPEEEPAAFTEIGEQMLTYYSPVLIAMALTLAGAVIGALVLAKVERVKKVNGGNT